MNPEQHTTDAAHEHWMTLALQQADLAVAAGEVPVGAVLVRDGELLAQACNQPISSSDPTAHAEIMALRAAAHAAGNYRLPGCTLYVTIEPCTMCVGALVHARIATVVFGAREPRAGAVVSQYRLLDGSVYNHKPEFIEGVMADACASKIQDFFRTRRQ